MNSQERKTTDYVSLFLIAVALSMDAFAVAIVNGMAIKNVRIRHAAEFGLIFGGLQVIMLAIGFSLGSLFSSHIRNISPWVAFILLVLIGGKMLIDSFRDKEKDGPAINEQVVSLVKIFVLGIAMSVDALVVGVDIALTQLNIWTSVLVMGAVAFILSFIGVLSGKRLGMRFQKNAVRAGGIILILIGVKILFEYLFV